jgi:hypothetical protein
MGELASTTDQDVVDALGLKDRSYVGKVRRDMVEDGQFGNSPNLTQKEKRERIRTNLRENPGKTDYAIGKGMGVSKNTVKRVRKDMEAEEAAEESSQEVEIEWREGSTLV